MRRNVLLLALLVGPAVADEPAKQQNGAAPASQIAKGHENLAHSASDIRMATRLLESKASDSQRPRARP